MFDMSWGEVMVIGGVALIVIGPKELPRALRTVGQMTTKVRRLAAEFQTQFSDAMREAELEDVKREVEGLNRSVSSAANAAFNPIQTIRDEIKGAIDRPLPSASTAAPVGAIEPAGAMEPLPPLPDPTTPLLDDLGPVPVVGPAEPAPPPAPPGAPVPLSPTGPGLEEPPAPPANAPAEPKGHAA